MDRTGKSTKYLINKTAEVYLEEIPVCKGDKVESYFLGLTQSANFTRTINTEEIRGGVSGMVFGVIKEDGGMSAAVTTAAHYEEVIGIQIGQSFQESEDISIHSIVEKEDGTFTASETKKAGMFINLDSATMPRNYKFQARSEAIDPKTNVTVADVYWIFDRANPDGNLNEVFELGTNKSQEINFTMLVPDGQTSYGKYVVIPRDVATCPDDTGE